VYGRLRNPRKGKGFNRPAVAGKNKGSAAVQTEKTGSRQGGGRLPQSGAKGGGGWGWDKGDAGEKFIYITDQPSSSVTAESGIHGEKLGGKPMEHWRGRQKEWGKKEEKRNSSKARLNRVNSLKKKFTR